MTADTPEPERRRHSETPPGGGEVAPQVVVVAKKKKRRRRPQKLFGVDTSDIPWKIYVSRGLSAWGDRMWTYGSGLFMTS